MGSFAVGEVVLVPFPFADFSGFKKRPALVIGRAEFDNLILCQITSQSKTSATAIKLTDQDFQTGGLKIVSFVRPDKLITVDQAVVQAKVGLLKVKKIDTIKTAVRKLFK